MDGLRCDNGYVVYLYHAEWEDLFKQFDFKIVAGLPFTAF